MNNTLKAKNCNIGDSVKIINAGAGAYGANHLTGVIIGSKGILEERVSGLNKRDLHVLVKISDNHIWRISNNADLLMIKRASNHKEYKLIVNDDDKVIVLLDKEGNKGFSKCMSGDKFDLGFGVSLAKARLENDKDEIDRLMKLDKLKDKGMTIGKLNLKLDVSFDEDIIKDRVEKTILELNDKFDKIKEDAIEGFRKSVIDSLKIGVRNGLDDLKVGDKVLIRNDLARGNYGDSKLWRNASMVNFSGCQATVVKLLSEGRFRIDVDNGDWKWNSDMLSKKL